MGSEEAGGWIGLFSASQRLIKAESRGRKPTDLLEEEEKEVEEERSCSDQLSRTKRQIKQLKEAEGWREDRRQGGEAVTIATLTETREGRKTMGEVGLPVRLNVSK